MCGHTYIYIYIYIISYTPINSSEHCKLLHTYFNNVLPNVPSIMSRSTIGGMGIRRFRPRGGHQNSPFRGQDCMILNMIGKLAPNSNQSTRGWSNISPGRAVFAPSPPKTRTHLRHLRPPQSLDDSNLRSTS